MNDSDETNIERNSEMSWMRCAHLHLHSEQHKTSSSAIVAVPLNVCVCAFVDGLEHVVSSLSIALFVHWLCTAKKRLYSEHINTGHYYCLLLLLLHRWFLTEQMTINQMNYI